jgi:hypothetical protein
MKKITRTLTILGLFGCLVALQSCYDETRDLAHFYDSEMSLEERHTYSYYDWEDTKKVTLEVKTPDDGLIKVRALNGEILFQGYLVNGVLSELTLRLPIDVDQLLIEHKGRIENVSCNGKKIRFSF